MIALCRALNIPARFVTSLDYGADPALGPPDFHAYVEVYLSGRWYIFDPTNICVTTGLVRIATGYDASDVAFATIFGNVMWTVPKVSIFAHDDPAAGITLPSPTTMAVSTSGPREARQTISAARAGNAPPSVVPVSSLLAELPTGWLRTARVIAADSGAKVKSKRVPRDGALHRSPHLNAFRDAGVCNC
jgi:hypothetical protein